MKRTTQEVKNRIHILRTRDPIANMNIINKLKRELRRRGE